MKFDSGFLPRWPTRLRRLPLKRQLGLVFLFLTLLAAGFAGAVMYYQHERSMQSGSRVLQEHSDGEIAAELSRVLGDVEDARRADRGRTTKFLRFKKLLSDLQADETSETGRSLLSVIDQRFDTYLAASDAGQGERAAFQDVAAAIESYRDLKRANIYRVASDMRREQERTILLAISLLLIFLAALLFTGFRIIRTVTQPLTKLAGTIDEIEVGSGRPPALPSVGWKFQEVSRVAESFRQLLERLHQYQALNVGRLIAEKRRADIIAASISDGIFLLRGDEVIYANPVAERILDLPAGSSWKGLNVMESVASLNGREDRSQFRGLIAVHSAMTRTMPVEFEIKSQDRDLFYILQSIPIPAELVESVEDSFEGPADGMMERWQATTLVLARDETLMRESQEAKSHFIGTLSHEIKTPVTSLTMATRLLKRSVQKFENETHRALIETCAEDVDRLRGLLEDLLSVSRFDTLTQKLDLKSVDLGKLLKQTVQHFQPQAFERGVEIAMRSDSRKRIAVPMDAAKVSWALSNLMTNALRHTPRGGKVEALIAVDEDFAEIRIRDHGPGIEKRRQDRIFDKFNPFYDLRVARSGSMGMGLAIAREIIVAHGGKIWVVSEPGRGAEFCFTLPLRRSIAFDEKSSASVSGSASLQTGEQSKNRSLASGVSQMDSDQGVLKGDYSGATSRG